MPQWDSKRFDDHATKVAHTFAAGSTSLVELTAKLAKEHSLNEEQIRRLGRAVNVKVFEQKFASLKGKADRIVEFDPVDPEEVIQNLFKSAAPAHEKQAAAAYPDLADELNPRQEKVASVNVKQALTDALPKGPSTESLIGHWRKVAEDLRVKVASAEIRWDGAMEQLLNHAKRLNWHRDEFEKNALALHGGDVLPEINAMRAVAKLPALPATYEDATKIASQVLGLDSEDTRLVKQAAAARTEYLQATRAVEQANNQVATLTKRLLG